MQQYFNYSYFLLLIFIIFSPFSNSDFQNRVGDEIWSISLHPIQGILASVSQILSFEMSL